MIPKAEEFIKSTELVVKFDNTQGCILEEELPSLFIEFAKLHVEAALEAASGKVQLSPELYDFVSDSWESGQWFDKKSILTAYPLDNIK